MIRLTDFRVLRPEHTLPQAQIRDWLVMAHARSAGLDLEAQDALRAKLDRYGCKPGVIRERGVSCPDFTHTDWSQMSVYRPGEQPQGATMHARMAHYKAAAQRVFDTLYEGDDPPDELLHVSCTGYASPSAAERLVSAQGWGARTRVAHVYHMGCYAAFPAITTARGYAAVRRVLGREGPWRADIVHTEFCGLHLDLDTRTPEQLVVQSLFADGCVRYSAMDSDQVPGLELLALREELVSGSLESMAWEITAGPMRMTLSSSVPLRIARHIEAFVERLFAQAGLDGRQEAAGAIFAVHPGGPRIIELVTRTLSLRPDQTALSHETLARYGNMSSATLPHLWGLAMEEPTVDDGALIVSLAFGPGLTMSGGLLRKRL